MYTLALAQKEKKKNSGHTIHRMSMKTFVLDIFGANGCASMMLQCQKR